MLVADSDDDDGNDHGSDKSKDACVRVQTCAATTSLSLPLSTTTAAATRRRTSPHAVATALLALLHERSCDVRRRNAVLTQLARVGGAYRVLCSGATVPLWMRYADGNVATMARLAAHCAAAYTHDTLNEPATTAYALSPGDRAALLLLDLCDADYAHDECGSEDDNDDNDGDDAQRVQPTCALPHAQRPLFPSRVAELSVHTPTSTRRSSSRSSDSNTSAASTRAARVEKYKCDANVFASSVIYASDSDSDGEDSDNSPRPQRWLQHTTRATVQACKRRRL